MIPANSNEFSHVGSMLNLGFLTGFVRKPTETGFLLQQTNNINHAIPITLEGKHRKFKEFEPVTIVAHGYGFKDANGNRSMLVKRVFDEKPTILTMPSEVVWESRLPEGMQPDEFKPFGDGWAKKREEAMADAIKEGASVEVDGISEIINATGGRVDRSLGSASNNFRCAGLVEAYAMARDASNNVVDDCLTILIRQHRDAEKSLPVRLYGKYARTYFTHLSIGRPIRIDGQIRVNYKAKEDGSSESYVYIHCSQIRTASPVDDIRSSPDWISDMKDRILNTVKEKQAAKQEAAKPSKPISGLIE